MKSHNRIHGILGPSQPVLHGGLDVKDGPTVQLGRVHLAHLILTAMLPAIDGGKDHGVRVQVVAGELAAVGQLEDALTDLGGRAVHFVEEQHDGGSLQHSAYQSGGQKEVVPPSVVGRPSKSPSVICEARRSTTGMPRVLGGLVDDAGLPNAVTASEQHGLADRGDVGCDW
jgi:hypothetical protein